MQLTHVLKGAATAVLALTLFACGGGGGSGGPAGGSAGGYGAGTVTGFGSIVVDGVHYDDAASTVSLDTEASAPDAPAAGASLEVKLGQHVEFEFSGDESHSVATRLRISAAVIGSVTAIAPQLVVAGQVIQVNTDPAAGPVTVFEGVASQAGIQVGDRLEVHGLPVVVAGQVVVQATRIERRPAREAWLRVAGTVAGLAADGSSFHLGGLKVNVAPTTRLVPAGATLADGTAVVVWSSTGAVNDAVTAALVRVRRHPVTVTQDIRLSGAVSGCTAPCAAGFKVDGLAVDASTATFDHGSAADLADGRWVDVRGTIDATTGLVTATRVAFRRMQDDRVVVRLKGAITDFVDAANFKVRGVPVSTDASTVVGAGCPAPLADGTLVSISGSISGASVLAGRIDCFTSPDGITVELKGVVKDVDPAAKTFTLVHLPWGVQRLSYGDATAFEGGTAADLKAGAVVEVKGSVSGGVLAVTKVEFEDGLPGVPGGVKLLETEGVVSGVVLSGGTVSSFQLNGMSFGVTADTVIRPDAGSLVEGVRAKVVFRQLADANVALWVRTRP